MGTIVFAAASVSGDSQKVVEVFGALFIGAGFIVAGLKFEKFKGLSESEEGKNVTFCRFRHFFQIVRKLI